MDLIKEEERRKEKGEHTHLLALTVNFGEVIFICC